MSDRTRTLLITALICLLPVVSFLAGFFTNEYIDNVNQNRFDLLGTPSERAGFDLFWEAWSHVERDFIGEQPGETQLTYAAIRGALGSLNDPYTVFLEPVVREEEEIQLRGNFGGIGAYVQRNDGGELILTIIPGNPAEAAGVQDGDILLAVDDVVVTAEMTVEAVVQMVRGEVGTEVVLRILRAGVTDALEITVERGTILVPSVIARLIPEQPQVGYVQLTRFSGESAGEMELAVADLREQGAQQLILDLRGNGGGLLDASVEIADQFIVEGDLLISQSKQDGERIYKATSSQLIAADIPLIVLVDGGTASASEILAGALQDSARATLIGSTTFGKGSVQLVYELSDGSSVHVTSARWFTPNRNQIDQQGLTPDILLTPTAEEVASGQDIVLQKAIEFFETGR